MFLRIRLFFLKLRIRSIYRRHERTKLRAALLNAKADYLKDRYEVLLTFAMQKSTETLDLVA